MKKKNIFFNNAINTYYLNLIYNAIFRSAVVDTKARMIRIWAVSSLMLKNVDLISGFLAIRLVS